MNMFEGYINLIEEGIDKKILAYDDQKSLGSVTKIALKHAGDL